MISFDSLNDTLCNYIFRDGFRSWVDSYEEMRAKNNSFMTFKEYVQSRMKIDEIELESNDFGYNLIYTEYYTHSICLDCSYSEFRSLDEKIEFLSDENNWDINFCFSEYVLIMRTGILKYSNFRDLVLCDLLKEYLKDFNFFHKFFKNALISFDLKEIAEEIKYLTKEELINSKDKIFDAPNLQSVLQKTQSVIEARCEKKEDGKMREQYMSILRFLSSFRELPAIFDNSEIEISIDEKSEIIFTFKSYIEANCIAKCSDMNSMVYFSRLFDVFSVAIYKLDQLELFLKELDDLDLVFLFRLSHFFPLNLSDVLDLPGRCFRSKRQRLQNEHRGTYNFDFCLFIKSIFKNISKISEWIFTYRQFTIRFEVSRDKKSVYIMREHPSQIEDLDFRELFKIKHFMEEQVITEQTRFLFDSFDLVFMSPLNTQISISDLQKKFCNIQSEPEETSIENFPPNWSYKSAFDINKKYPDVHIDKELRLGNISMCGSIDKISIEVANVIGECKWIGKINTIQVKTKDMIFCIIGSSVLLQLNPRLIMDFQSIDIDQISLPRMKEVMMDYFERSHKTGAACSFFRRKIEYLQKKDILGKIYGENDSFNGFCNTVLPTFDQVILNQSEDLYFEIENCVFIYPIWEYVVTKMMQEKLSVKKIQHISYNHKTRKLFVLNSCVVFLGFSNTQLEFINMIGALLNDSQNENDPAAYRPLLISHIRIFYCRKSFFTSTLILNDVRSVFLTKCTGVQVMIQNPFVQRSQKLHIEIVDCDFIFCLGTKLTARRKLNFQGFLNVSLNINHLVIRNSRITQFECIPFDIRFENCYLEDLELDLNFEIELICCTGYLKIFHIPNPKFIELFGDCNVIIKRNAEGEFKMLQIPVMNEDVTV